MWKLPAPDVNAVLEELRTALTYANGTPVYELDAGTVDSILDFYTKYDAAEGIPSDELKAPEMQAELLEAIYTAYGEVQDGRRLSALRDRIKLLTRVCPYCGFGEITELDHQLPRLKFKLFSIYPRNLVPSCHHCNNKKRAIAHENPEEQISHVYFFQSPNEIFLKATAGVSAAGLVVEYRIERPAGMSQAVAQRLNYQLDRLNLNERYQPEINTFMLAHRTAIQDAYGEGDPVTLRAFLEKCAGSSVRDFGLNDWRTALWKALYDCGDFYSGGFVHAFGAPNPGA